MKLVDWLQSAILRKHGCRDDAREDSSWRVVGRIAALFAHSACVTAVSHDALRWNLGSHVSWFLSLCSGAYPKTPTQRVSQVSHTLQTLTRWLAMHQQRCLFCRHRNLFVAGTPHFDPPIHGCGRSRCWGCVHLFDAPCIQTRRVRYHGWESHAHGRAHLCGVCVHG